MNEDLIKILVKEAEKSDLNFRHSAALIQKRGQKIINLGYNHYIYSRTYSIHAEQKVSSVHINNFKKGDINIVIIRINKKNELRYSRPCNNCIKYLQNLHYSIKNVYYSTNDGTIVCENLNNMSYLHTSKAYRSINNTQL